MGLVPGLGPVRSAENKQKFLFGYSSIFGEVLKNQSFLVDMDFLSRPIYGLSPPI